IGGGYPPSWSDSLDGNGFSLVGGSNGNPYSQNSNGPSGQIAITGAGLLTWALAGADQLGCPGFKAFRDASTNPHSLWSVAADSPYQASPSPSGAYALYPLTDPTRPGQPVHGRAGPFVDLSKVKMTSWNANAVTSGGNGSFEILEEKGAAENTGAQVA